MGSTGIRIAVIDDEKISGRRLQEHLLDMGYPVDIFFDGAAFLKTFLSSPHDLVVTDLKMPGIDGLEILRRVKERRPETEVVVITGYASVDTAIEATRAGAFYYLTKPIRLDEFENLILRAIEKIMLMHEADNLRALIQDSAGREGMIGTSREMVRVYRLIEKVAPLDCPVIIQGESGTGKELVARAIHRLSLRRNAPMVSFNCGGFSPELIANELFGHEKGAFTGAFSSRMGLLETADQGTVLLDEIAEMPQNMQVKLLRVIQEGQAYRVGANQPKSIDIRILAASNRDLENEVHHGRFREDLFFRLNVMTVTLPRLVDRVGDLWLLADHFLGKFNQSYGKKNPWVFSGGPGNTGPVRFPGQCSRTGKHCGSGGRPGRKHANRGQRPAAHPYRRRANLIESPRKPGRSGKGTYCPSVGSGSVPAGSGREHTGGHQVHPLA